MYENENLVTDTVAENVEQTTEQTPKTYTEAEFNAKLDEVLGKKIARKEAKIRKEFERKYGDLENVLKAGTGKDDLGEMTDTFRKFYENKGIEIPERSAYSESDIELLARSDADEIINAGYEEVVEEVNRLADIGTENLSPREVATLRVLAEHQQSAVMRKELSEIGVTEDVYGSQEFKDFAAKFNPKTPTRDIYDIYVKTKPQKEIRTAGSMKNSITDNGTVKDFYTRDEALRFTKADFDKNPALYRAVEQSMQKW